MSPKKRKLVKIVVYVPVSHAERIRKVLHMYSGGKMGHYDHCTFSQTGTGRFRPLKGSNPHLGQTNKLEKVAEERIETILEEKDIAKMVRAVKIAHPYEEPAIDIYPLLYPA